MFLLGSVMLVAGELLNRKKPNIFSARPDSGRRCRSERCACRKLFWAANSFYVSGPAPLRANYGRRLCPATRYHAQVVLTFASSHWGPFAHVFLSAPAVRWFTARWFILSFKPTRSDDCVSKNGRLLPFIGLSLNIIGAAYISVRMFSLYYNEQGGPLSIAATLLYLFDDLYCLHADSGRWYI